MRSFASDNAAGVLPEVMAAIVAANVDHAVAYGNDPWTERAVAAVRRELVAPAAAVAFVFGGTGANVVALHTALAPFEAVLCAATAHIHIDECGAPERITGCKLLPVPTVDGKLTPAALDPYLALHGDVHHVQPRIVSVSQSTEVGTLYQPDELRALADFAHAHGMLLHVDGARLTTAAAALGVSLADLTSAVGVDLLSWGGTKSGLLFGEVVVAFDPTLARSLAFARKQAGQLPSKMRFIAAQFEALLSGDTWRRAASNANSQASRLATGLADLPGVTLDRWPEANAVFAVVSPAVVAALGARYDTYVWDRHRSLVRLMTSWDTTAADVDELLASLSPALASSAPSALS